ncbi:MAG: hypothetical protein WCY84_00195 [Candidatus Cloacimonadaceae bacterium]
MLIKAPMQGVHSDVLHRKLFERLSALEREFPHYPKAFQGLSHQELAHFLAYEIPEMKPIYEKWSGLSQKEPSDYFPAYCRLRRVFAMIDLNQKEIPLIDSQRHMFLNDLEFLCFADLSRLLTKQGVFDLLGIDLQVLPEE